MFGLMMIGASPLSSLSLRQRLPPAGESATFDAGTHMSRRLKERVFSNLFLNTIALSIAGINIICSYNDVNLKGMVSHGGLGRANGFEAIIIVNLVLMVGIIFCRQLLIAIWICVYAFILVLCSIQSMVENRFPWTPGISYSSTTWIMDYFKLDEQMRPVVATTLTLCCFLLVFLVFMAKGVMKFQDAGARRAVAALTRAGAANGGGARRNNDNLDPYSGILDLLRQAQASQLGTTSSDSLPAYSDLEACENSSLPPNYDEATKDLERGEEVGKAKTKKVQPKQNKATAVESQNGVGERKEEE